MEARTLHSKGRFWRIERTGTVHTVSFGRTGRAGRELVREFENEEQSERAFRKRVAAMLEKGYELAPEPPLRVLGERPPPAALQPLQVELGPAELKQLEIASQGGAGDTAAISSALMGALPGHGQSSIMRARAVGKPEANAVPRSSPPTDEPSGGGVDAPESEVESDAGIDVAQPGGWRSEEMPTFDAPRGAGEVPAPLSRELPADLAVDLRELYPRLSQGQRGALWMMALFDIELDLRVLGVLVKQASMPKRFSAYSKESCSRLIEELVQGGRLRSVDAELYQPSFGLGGECEKLWRWEAGEAFDDEWQGARHARLCTYADLASWFCHTLQSGHIENALQLLEARQASMENAALEALKDQSDVEARKLLQALHLYAEMRDPASARRFFERCRQLLENGDADRALHGGRSALWLFLVQANLESALAAGSSSVQAKLEALAAKLEGVPNDEAQRALGWTCNQLGILARKGSDWEKAGELFSRAIDINTGLGDSKGLAASYHQLADIERELGRLDQAEAWLESCAAIETQLQDARGIATTCEQLGQLAEAKGQYQTAERHLRKSLRIKVKRGDRAGLLSSYRQLGNVAFRQRKLEEAEEWYLKAQEISQALGEKSSLLPIYRRLGRVAQEKGQFDQAEKWFRFAMQHRDSQNRNEIANGYRMLGTAAFLAGNYDAAQETYRLALAILEARGQKRGLLPLLFELGTLAAVRGQAADVEKWRSRFFQLSAELAEGDGAEESADGIALDSAVQAISGLPRGGHEATSKALEALAALTERLGLERVKRSWRLNVGEELPADFARALPHE